MAEPKGLSGEELRKRDWSRLIEEGVGFGKRRRRSTPNHTSFFLVGTRAVCRQQVPVESDLL